MPLKVSDVGLGTKLLRGVPENIFGKTRRCIGPATLPELTLVVIAVRFHPGVFHPTMMRLVLPIALRTVLWAAPMMVLPEMMYRVRENYRGDPSKGLIKTKP